MSKPLYENEVFVVTLTDDAIGEDGNYGRKGYAVVNKDTGVVEHTTVVLAQAQFQAEAFKGALSQLNEDDAAAIGASEDPDILLQ